MLGESVLTSAKRVGCLQKFMGSALTIARCVGGFQSVGKSVLTIAGCRRLAENLL